MNTQRRILVIGSGPIIIGQAAEFDYAGTQACKSLKEEGCYVILVNSNPATIMTDVDTADKVYVEPLTIEIIEKIIIKESPDGILGTLGGQTGLNLVKDLYDKKILKKHNVEVLGTSVESINKAEDRLLFRDLMNELGEPVPPSFSCNTVDEALKAAREINYPVIVRPAFTLGGTGGGVAYNDSELKKISYSGISASMVGQILVEKCLVGWKEVEYEVIRDSDDNAITVCNMENFDPMGVHTGDSIVVAPSQTLSDKDYQELRTSSLNIIKGLKIEGGCNVQLAFRPFDSKNYEGPNYYVIEVNPRVSRSSALASKATGYPIARVAAKIALGKKLDEISNQVTGVTTSAFEPALDYCVVKIPRWPFDKFEKGDRTIGTQMKATGEVMAIERNFESALLKAVRALDISNISQLKDKSLKANEVSDLYPDDTRLFKIFKLLRKGIDLEDIYNFTGIDKWFLTKLKIIINHEEKLSKINKLDKEILKVSKKIGFSDETIASLTNNNIEEIRNLRKKWSILPTYKMVDTCASEFEALTPYYYSTYESENEAEPDKTDKAIVLGSGPIRIGQGIEFDYCSVHAAWSLQKRNIDSIFINSNPETVSTDFDTSDRLYFEPIDQESVFDILENEQTSKSFPATIVQFGGQTAINLTKKLENEKYPILGTSAKSTELASDRGYFEEITSKIGVPQPPAGTSINYDEAKKIANQINYPVIVRPSFVLGGMAMRIIDNDIDLENYFNEHDFSNLINPEILIDKYIEGIELEIDAVSDGKDILIPGIMMHLEKAGVHSGDSVAVYPAKGITEFERNIILEYSKKIAQEINIIGLMNIQFILDRSKNNSKVYVIEVNPRSSRTVPFISKATGVPMIDLAVGCMQGEKLIDSDYGVGLYKERNIIAVKAPVFSMSKLTDVDTFLGPEMKSTGEVMGISNNYEEALSKALISSGNNIPSEGSVLLSIANKDKEKAKFLINLIHKKGYKLIATPGTAELISKLGYQAEIIEKSLDKNPNVIDMLRNSEVIAVVNTVSGDNKTLQDGFKIRRESTERKIPCFTSLDTAEAVFKDEVKEKNLSVFSLDEYLSF
ncbi:MAG: carbamoyl-phosphate synthase (glutamine-hydrolyzing) large subunit [Dehalococcoidia bacterium]